ncbi:MAG: DUF4134 domain-containing protein [Paludibacteraceae bacterium]|nr:DUF4134 domain-containing protein [Paludibacteraceae bacterium]
MINAFKKFACTGVLACANAVMCFAQASKAGKIKDGLDSATSTVTGLFDSAVKLLYAVCAIMACIGAFQVYSKWTSGDPDVTKTAAGWIGGLVFVVVAIVIIEKVFI